MPPTIRTIILCFLLSATHSAAQASLILNGLAVHEEFGQPLFIGAVYSSTAQAAADQLLKYDGQRKMELRIVAPRLSHRRLNKFWVEGAAVNSSRDTLINQARHMARFTSLIKRPLQAGDQLTILSTNTEETKVLVNDVLMGEIKSRDFFNLILKTWVGRVPLSSKYRQDILNNQAIDTNLREQFETTTPTVARRNIIESWVSPLPETKLEIAVSAAEPVLIDSPSTTTAQEPAATEAPPEPVKNNAKIASKAKRDETKSRKIAEQAKKAQLAMQIAEEEQAAKILLSRQLYQSELMRQTYKNIRYPSRAVEKGQEGSIRMEITLDREGQLTDIQALESSRYSLLNKAAARSIERSTPYPPIPDVIEGEQFKFTLPIVFRLQ